MAFVKVNKSTHGPSHADHSVRMGAHMQSHKGTTRGIYFSISQSVVEQVGWDQHKSEKRLSSLIHLQEGVGEDAGFILLVEAEDRTGYSLGTTRDEGNAFCMNVSSTRLKHYVLNEVPMPTAPVEFTIDEKEKTILIQCPDWLRYNSLSYTEPEKPKPPVQEARRAPHPIQPSLRAEVDAVAKELKDKYPEINRKQRRAAVSAVTRALS